MQIKGKTLFSILKRLFALKNKSTCHIPAKFKNKIALRNGLVKLKTSKI